MLSVDRIAMSREGEKKGVCANVQNSHRTTSKTEITEKQNYDRDVLEITVVGGISRFCLFFFFFTVLPLACACPKANENK